ncbi:MAG TPA: tRNA (adenosine(37)-N6)-threonylcarbamoyltransferase complex ATPase subunit type 1 TsaE [candidate division Zixibacteria bacterium]|nr:tRNA (adenosine(37)-N6)-threonylcarbamoyltransferase complex ATPase subunit type 1 TsaE [candidate division Zixibacteria bacterium]
MASWSVVTRSPRQTAAWGQRLGELLEGGEIVGLVGELGAGKTCFVRGLVQGAGVGEKAWIRSPSFTLINEYHGRVPIYHIDLYRIGTAEELDGLNLRECLYSDGVSVIEWFERLPSGEVDEYIEVRMEFCGPTGRRLTFTAHGGRYEETLERLKEEGFRAGSRDDARAKTAG